MYNSQVTEKNPIPQDRFVVETLQGKRDGTFLDVGCHDYKHISNSYYLEKELGWKGLGVDYNIEHKHGWDQNRKSLFIHGDATSLDYSQLLSQHDMPKEIDYLSVDIEPPPLTLQALYKVFETNYIFKVITFETDFYHYTSTREPSRKFLTEHGYILVYPGEQDDFYIHNSVDISNNPNYVNGMYTPEIK